MRRVLLAAAMVAMSVSAQAADMPDFLRGSVGYTPVNNWQGFYVGGQGAYGSSDVHFSGSNGSMLSSLISNTDLVDLGVAGWNLPLGGLSQRSTGFGGFAGYNWQWDDVVVGLEASYLHGTFGATASAQKGPIVNTTPLGDNTFHNVTVVSSDSIGITDMATFRARAGYAYGIFLPYMFGGLALGNGNISQSVSVQDNWGTTLNQAIAPCGSVGGPSCNHLAADNALHNHLIFGYSAGLGVDIKLVGGLFMRAEWEYTRFVDQIEVNMNTVRAGLGYKF